MSLLLLASLDGAPAVVLAVAGVSAADVAGVTAAALLPCNQVPHTMYAQKSNIPDNDHAAIGLILSCYRISNTKTIGPSNFRRSVLQLFNYVCAICMQAESSYSNGL